VVAENHFLVELYHDDKGQVVVICSLGHSFAHEDIRKVARWVIDHLGVRPRAAP